MLSKTEIIKPKKIKAKINDFSQLQWNTVENDKGVKSLTTREAYIEGKYTRDALKKELQELSQKFYDAKKLVRIGVAFKYKTSKSWVPAYLNDAGSKDLRIYDPNDSGKGKMYIDDEISAICFYAMKGLNETNEPKNRKPKQKKMV